MRILINGCVPDSLMKSLPSSFKISSTFLKFVKLFFIQDSLSVTLILISSDGIFNDFGYNSSIVELLVISRWIILISVIMASQIGIIFVSV